MGGGMGSEPEEYIQVLKEENDGLKQKLSMAEKSIQLAIEIKEKYQKQLKECQDRIKFLISSTADPDRILSEK